MTGLERILVFLGGMALMSIVRVAIDRSLGVKVSGSIPARIGHNILGMIQGAFLVWLMSVTEISSQ